MSLNMNCQDIRTNVLDAIKHSQELSGEEEVPIEDDTCLFDEIPNFDSMRAAEVTVTLSEELECEIDDMIDLFTPTDNQDCLNLGEVVNRLCAIAGNKSASVQKKQEENAQV